MLGPKPDAPERETWEFVTDPVPSFGRMLTAYGVRIGGDIFWVHTATDLTALGMREKYRQRCLLMSAAPDLLEAAKAALAKLEAICRFCDERVGKQTDVPCGKERCHMKRLIRQIKIAIENAEGRDAGERDAD